MLEYLVDLPIANTGMKTPEGTGSVMAIADMMNQKTQNRVCDTNIHVYIIYVDF